MVAAVLSANGHGPGWSAEPPSANASRFRGEEIVGTRGPDALRGTSAGDLLFSFGGNDRIDAGDGSDLIDSGNSADTVYAGPGDDRIRAFDGSRDDIDCGEGLDIAHVDAFDTTVACEELVESGDPSSPATPDPPLTVARDPGRGPDQGPADPLRGSFVLEDEQWECEGPVNVDLVKVTIRRRSTPLDAVSLGQNCSGRIGRVEVDTWSGDGIKVQNAGTVAHDLVIESGYVRCYDQNPGYHQDGIQAMGGNRITFRNLLVSCGRLGVNANLFIARGGMEASTPTGIVFDNGRLGPDAAHTILLADAVRSGVRRTLICPGRWFDYMIQQSAVAPVDERNTSPQADDPRCSRVKVR